MSVHDELLAQFLIEGRELVERAADDLTRLARNEGDRAALDGLFRSVHTLKGSAGLFDLPGLTALLHATETLLESSRTAGALGAASQAEALRALDVTEAWLEALDEGGPTDALAKQTAAALGRLTGEAATAPAAPGPTSAAWARTLALESAGDGPVVAIRYTPAPDAYFRGDDPLAVIRGVPGLARLRLSADPADDAYDPFQCTLVIEAAAAAPMADVRAALRLVIDQVELAVMEAPDAGPRAGGETSLRSMRVDAARLDELAAIMDELVIAKNVLIYETERLAAVSGQGRGLVNAQASLERLTSDLHAAVTGLRLVSLSHIFSRFPRQVREIAEALGKEVSLTISGDQVAVDKSVVEGLFEPLLHLVRNALDHGIEPPHERVAAGKPGRASLTIAAHARGEEVTIDVTDDGRGVDIEQVRRTAAARGLVSAETAAELPDAEVADLIFGAGFSTAATVTDLSGRGVGLDAVRVKVTELGGGIALDNRPGQGLSVRLSLPARILLTKILVVTAGGERFGVPLEAVSETHRVGSTQVTAIRAGRAYVRRDRVIPLLRLADLLGAPAPTDAQVFPVLNVSAGGEPVGIEVDEIAERIEAPLRPMSGLLAAYPGVMGTVLQANGQVLLVLDLAELAA